MTLPNAVSRILNRGRINKRLMSQLYFLQLSKILTIFSKFMNNTNLSAEKHNFKWSWISRITM